MKKFISLLLIYFATLFLAHPASALVNCTGTSDCHVYVDLSSANTADCGTEEGTDDNNAFCSLAAAEAAFDADISGWANGADMYFHLKGGDSADGPVAINGWHTDTDNRVILQVDPEDRNTGATYSTSHYRIEVNAAANNTRGIVIAENFVEVYGVQIQVTNNDYDNACGIYAYNSAGYGEIVLGYLRLVGANLTSSGNDDVWGMRFFNIYQSVILFNSVVYGFNLSDPGVVQSKALYLGAFNEMVIYNTVVANSNYGFFESDSPIACYNCAAYNNTDNWYGEHWTGTNNATTGPDTTGCPATSGSCVTLSTDGSDFTDPDGGDYTITDENSVLYGAGIDLDADLSVGWQDDIIGTDRDTNAPWDIGAFEFIDLPIDCTDDVDNDRICDDVDNCLGIANSDQSDSDSDGVGDVCDVCPATADDQSDSDSDGVGDACDVCPDTYDDQSDSDSDGVGDACDSCPADPNKTEPGICGCGVSDVDSDSDGIPDCNDTETTTTTTTTTSTTTTTTITTTTTTTTLPITGSAVLYDFDNQVWGIPTIPLNNAAGRETFVEVSENYYTPANDVLFKFTNLIPPENTIPVGDASMKFIYFDYGNYTDLVAGVTIWEQSTGVHMAIPGNRTEMELMNGFDTYFTEDFSVGPDPSDILNYTQNGINPGEYLVLNVTLGSGKTIDDLYNALDVGRDPDEIVARTGFRISEIVHRIWGVADDADHAAFVHSSIIDVSGPALVISSLTATPSVIPDNGTSLLEVVALDLEPGPSALSYQWTIVSGGGVLDDDTLPDPVYYPEDIVGSQSVTLRVEVSDGESMISDEITLTVDDADPPPPGVDLLVEDFSSGSLAGWSIHDDGTVIAPSKWRALGTIYGHELVQNSSIHDGGADNDLPHLGTYLSYDGGMGWTDYRLQFSMRTAGDIDTMGVMFRIADSGNYYRFTWDQKRNQRRLVKNTGGVFTLLAADTVPYVRYQNYQVEVIVQGDQIEVWIDGVRIFHVTDSDHGYGTFGFHTWKNSSAYFDDVRVEDLSGGTFNIPPQIVSVDAVPASILDTETSDLLVVANDPDSGPSALSYQWTIVNGGGSLDDATLPNPVYSPVDVSATESVTLHIEVSDGDATASSNLILQVLDADAPPANLPPVISTLDAVPATILDTETSDLLVVANDPDGGPSALSYQWTIMNGGGAFNDDTLPDPIYYPDDIVGSQSVTLRVEVSDGESMISDEVTLTVDDANPPPPGVDLLVEDFSSGSLAGWSIYDDGTINAPSRWRVVGTLYGQQLAQHSFIHDGGADDDLAHLATYISYDGGMAWTDYRLQFTMRTSDIDTMGVMFRTADSYNYYRFTWDQKRNQRRLVKNTGGVFTLLAADDVPYVRYQNYQVEIVVQGDQIEIWIDGVRIFQVTDSDHGYGTFGFHAWKNSSAYFDDVWVEDLSGG